jgi:hypothetical protein
MIRVRCLWLRPDIIAERVAREEAQRVQRTWKFACLFLRNRALAGTTGQSLSVEERLQLLRHCKHRSQKGPKLHPAEKMVGGKLRVRMSMYIQYSKSKNAHRFITVHAIEGNRVAGGAERSSW